MSDDKQLLGEIHANTQLLLKRTETIESQIYEIQKAKADIMLVEKIETTLKQEVKIVDKKLTDHLNNIDEIVATKTRPYIDELNDHGNRISSLEKKVLKIMVIGGVFIFFAEKLFDLVKEKITFL